MELSILDLEGIQVPMQLNLAQQHPLSFFSLPSLLFLPLFDLPTSKLPALIAFFSNPIINRSPYKEASMDENEKERPRQSQ